MTVEQDTQGMLVYGTDSGAHMSKTVMITDKPDKPVNQTKLLNWLHWIKNE